MANDPEVDDITNHLKRHAIVQIDAGFPNPGRSLDGFDLQGGVAEIANKER